ncbi:MAG: hypothetical protein HQ568_09945 [Calditrichaeota bacterium]|nr:hypothetical protein [Calditrichota bacterium]
MDNQQILKKCRWRIVSHQLLPVVLVVFTVILLGSCDTFMGNIEGDVNVNQSPTIEFTNVPVAGDTFSYAPVISWKGRDSDGFVEYYVYADITDSAALDDPGYYINFIPSDAWITDTTTSDTIYLLTETGKITEHIFYIFCVDDQDSVSKVIYRSFYRTNQPPNVPEIKWWGEIDEVDTTDYTVEDTLYCLDNITDTWPGLGFSWKSSDPDDKALYTIPLQYRYYLEKVPHDTIWEWVADSWTSIQELQFSGLETGHYKFTVWARDDGLERCSRPATGTFDVYKPTFDEPILLLNLTTENNNSSGNGNISPGTQVGELYQLLSANNIGSDNVVIQHFPNDEGVQPWKSLLGRFKLIVLFSENVNMRGNGPSTELAEYLNIGGRLWTIGSYIRRTNLISDTLMNMADCRFSDPQASFPPSNTDFIGASSGVDDMPDINIDTSKIIEVFESFIGTSRMPYLTLPGVDIMATGSSAETVYYFTSYTDTLNGDVVNDTAWVRTWADVITYPPTPVGCLIKMPQNKILEINRVVNETRGVTGEVQSWTYIITSNWQGTIARVSYEYGEPWSVDDLIIVDYRYQPTSETHLRPCAIRYEKLSDPAEGLGKELRYRIAVFTFPLYFLDNSEGKVDEMFANMLEWFNQTQAH